MPFPAGAAYAQLAKMMFASKAIALPQSWSQPNDQFQDAFAAGERIAPPNSPTNLFREPTLNQYHVDAARDIGKKFETFIDGICGATCSAISQWLTSATIVGGIVNGPVASGGSVLGPPLTPLIVASAPKTTPQELKYSMAVANAFGTAWQAWHMGLKIPGLPLYPAFAAFPAPIAPPMPNIPFPLVVLPSPGEAMLAPGTLKGSMVGNLGDPTALHAADLFDALTQAFSPQFMIFKASTIVKNVLGTGPVPTFAPPFVPVGPVIGGIATGPPGCLS